VTLQGLIVAVALGAAALALWLEVRLGHRAPERAVWIFGHAVAALAAFNLAPRLADLLSTDDSLARRMLALFVVVLPAFVYAFLASIWVIKLIQRSLRLR